MKSLSPTAEIRIRAKITKIGKNAKNGKNHAWTVFWCCVTVFMKDWHWRVVIRYRSCKLIKIPSFGCKVPLWCVLTDKYQLRWIETPRIYSLFGGRLGLLQFRDCEECCAWTVGLNSLGKHVRMCDRENRGGGVRSN